MKAFSLLVCVMKPCRILKICKNKSRLGNVSKVSITGLDWLPSSYSPASVTSHEALQTWAPFVFLNLLVSALLTTWAQCWRALHVHHPACTHSTVSCACPQYYNNTCSRVVALQQLMLQCWGSQIGLLWCFWEPNNIVKFYKNPLYWVFSMQVYRTNRKINKTKWPIPI